MKKAVAETRAHYAREATEYGPNRDQTVRAENRERDVNHATSMNHGNADRYDNRSRRPEASWMPTLRRPNPSSPTRSAREPPRYSGQRETAGRSGEAAASRSMPPAEEQRPNVTVEAGRDDAAAEARAAAEGQAPEPTEGNAGLGAFEPQRRVPDGSANEEDLNNHPETGGCSGWDCDVAI